MTIANEVYILSQMRGLNDEQMLQESLVLASCLLKKNSKTREDLSLNVLLYIDTLRSMTTNESSEVNGMKE